MDPTRRNTAGGTSQRQDQSPRKQTLVSEHVPVLPAGLQAGGTERRPDLGRRSQGKA